MANLIKRCYFTYLFPARNFYFFSFFLFLVLLFLFSFLFFEFNPQICKLELNHVINHFLNLILYFRKDSLFYLSCLRLIFSTCLVFPFFGVLFYLLLHYQNGLSWPTSRIIFLKLVFLSEFFLLFLTLSFLFLLGFC